MDILASINWFPGHMAQTRRLIRENLKSVDIVLELLDARIPESSRNPEIGAILGEKKRIVILNKEDLADPELTLRWKEAFQREGLGAVPLDCKSGKGLRQIMSESKRLLADKIRRDREKGMTKPIRAMVVGIPNVGKSTLINCLAGAKKAKTEDRAGVTRQKQWIKAGPELELLDTPGVLWPKFEDVETGVRLAVTGAIKDAILPTEEVACALCGLLRDLAPEMLSARYKLTPEDLSGDAREIFLTVGKKRGMLVKYGEIDCERCAAMLLDEFRSGKIGRITLEAPSNDGLSD